MKILSRLVGWFLGGLFAQIGRELEQQFQPSAQNSESGQKMTRSSASQMTPTLVMQSEAYWAKRNDTERRAYYKQIDANYNGVVDEFYTQADNAVDKYKQSNNSHIFWRRLITCLTGVLAMLNVVIAYTTGEEFLIMGMNPLKHLPIFAAAYAVLIAILNNLEGLNQYIERAQAFREIREIFLGAGREYEMLWNVYVRPFGDGPTACINAANLYSKIVAKDGEIRVQAKELIKTDRTQTKNAGPATG